jgi:antirestriction protein
MSDPERSIHTIETQAAPTRPRIWVAPLTGEPSGPLPGRWLDAARDPDELQDAITWMLLASADPRNEDWGICDYEGFGPLQLEVGEDLTTVSRVARGIIAHGPAFAAWVELTGTEPEMLDEFETAYLGRWDTITDYAQRRAADSGYLELLGQAVPAHLKPYVYFDFEAFGWDLISSGEVLSAEAPEGGVWLFSLAIDGRGP